MTLDCDSRANPDRDRYDGRHGVDMSLLALPLASCEREELAAGPHCKIERCHCGVLHLTLGSITVRSTPEVAQSLLVALHHALVRLELQIANGSVAGSASS